MKRLSIVAAVVVVVALIVVPAAFAGLRPVAADGYTPVDTCRACHGASIPPVSDWAQTAHASVANNTEQSNRAACAGCHSGNFDPAQPIAWDEDPASPGYGLGDNPTEAFVSCSSCHFNMANTHKGSVLFNQSNPDPNFSPLAYGRFANPDVCGQCHDQRSQAKATYPVYNPADPANPTPTILRFWPPYDPYTTPLADVINIGSQLVRWPNSTFTQNVHDTGAVQYDEMAQGWYSGSLPVPPDTPLPITHFNSWAVLNTMVPDTAVSANEKINFCGHCMSADQRILVSAGKLVVPADPNQTPTDSTGKPVTKDQIKYGDSCVACHDPHKRGVSNSVWGGEHEGDATERNAQLIMPRKDLCASCHNGELAEGQTTFAPGAEINHPTKEFMDGIGAIDVPKMPALHKGFCVQCHMVPTAITGNGDASVAANHVFTPIMPDEAMNTTGAINISGSAEIIEAEQEVAGDPTVTITTRTPLNWDPTAVGKNVTIAGVAEAGYNGTFAVTEIVSASSFRYTNTVTDLPDSLSGGNLTFSAMPTTKHMPYSACSTCHEGTNGDNVAKTEGMQEIIDQRQEWTGTMVDEVMATLDAKAVQMGFADAEAAIADPDVANSDFGKAWTNMMLVKQEGSFGVHNWQYGVAVINKAMEQADAFRVPVTKVSILASKASVNFGSTISLSGTVTLPAGGPALMPGDEVRLYINGTPGSFATLNGPNYSFTGIQPNKNTTYKILFVGDANYAPTFGDSTTVNVSYRVTLSASKRSVNAGAKVTLNGTVGPTAGPVTIQRQVNGVWKTFKSGVGVNSRSRFDFTFTTKKGTYKFRAVKAATANVMKGMSGVVTVTAR